VFGEQRHKNLYYIGVALLGFGMMLGTVPTSVPQFILLGNWVLEGRFVEKWQRLKSNKFFWVLASVFLMHVIGLAYTKDLEAGFNDIRIKIPLLLLPLIIFSSPIITLKELKWIVLAFIVGCVCNVTWCLFYTYTKLGNQPIRQASRFMSHIRLSLLLNVAIVACYWCILQFKNRSTIFLFGVVIIFFIIAMIKLALMTALFILIFVLLVLVGNFIRKQGIVYKLIGVGVILIGCFGFGSYLKSAYDEQFYIANSPNNQVLLKSKTGKLYYNYPEYTQRENGFYVYRNIQFEEIQQEWNKRFPDDSIKYSPYFINMKRSDVLVRYMSSLGLTKDSAGIAQLKWKDIKQIKNNITNYKAAGWNGLRKRVYELFFEYQEFLRNSNASGHSLSMRLFFWSTASHIISRHPFIGVGTGDAQLSFNNAYKRLNVPLKKEWRLRSHNQFLAITVAFGFIGLLIFIFSIVYPVWTLKSYLPFLYLPFLGIALLSFLVEDTLETQTGLTFFAFFNTLLLSIAYFQMQKLKSESDK
jgi:hypothetical protein